MSTGAGIDQPIAIGFLLLFFTIAPCTYAQQPCPGPPPIEGTAKGNIFSEQQEMELGDALAQQFERDFRVVQNAQLNSNLNQIGQRLLAQMPSTQMRFRFVLVNIPAPNAFTMPGGRIYVARKLVAFVQSEDELAGVLGHELGHALTHQPAADMSRLLREVLGVTQVGDRADIFTKYNQMIENAGRKHLHFSRKESQEEQLVADRYGLYAVARAGYSPEAMLNFWDRLAETGGKTGSWLTDLFGATKPSEQRLRAMKKYIGALAAACVAPHPPSNAEQFRTWQAEVVAYATAGGKESLPGLLWKRQLSPALQSEINEVRFSPDGKLLLAQDDFAVYVLARDPLKPIFRIPVDDAEPATFTPDSQSVLIWTHGLHVEKWSVAEQKRTDVREVVTQKPCLQSAVSPSGNMVACVRAGPDESSLQFQLIDVASGASLVEKKDFYQPTLFDSLEFFLSALSEGRWELFHMGFSPDERFFAISRWQTVFGWNLKERVKVNISNSVKDMMSGGFVFVSPDRLVGIDQQDPQKSGVVQFPAGPPGKRIPMRGQRLHTAAHGDYFIVRPAGDMPAGVVDLKTGKVIGSQMSALDVYDNVYVRPRPDGTVGLYDVETRRALAETSLPGHFIGRLRTAQVSQDLKWFAGSGRTRGGVWNLTTGERVFHVRGFRGCHFAPDGKLAVDFPKFQKQERSVGILDPVGQEIVVGQEIGDVPAVQHGRYLALIRQPKGKFSGPADLEVRDAISGAVLWSKHYAHQVPRLASTAVGDEITMVSTLSGDVAKEEMKQNAALTAQVKQLAAKDSAWLVQVMDLKDGTVRGEFAVDTGKGSFTVREALPAGKWVVVTDNRNRVLIYSRDGALAGRLFGTRPVVSGAGERVALESESGTVEIYDVATITRQEELAFGVPLAHYEFTDSGTKLFVLTENQTAYLLDLTRAKSD